MAEYTETLTKFKDLKVKAIETKSQVAQHLALAREYKARYQNVSEQLEQLKTTAIHQQASIDTMKEILDALSQQHLTYLSNLTSYALANVFQDAVYSVEFLVGHARNNKTVEPILVKKTSDGEIRTSLLEQADESSGGVQSVVGFVLQLYYIILNNLPPILFMDEPFAQLSTENHANLMNFIDELVKDKHFIFPIITHDDRLTAKADKVYEVSKGHAREIMR